MGGKDKIGNSSEIVEGKYIGEGDFHINLSTSTNANSDKNESSNAPTRQLQKISIWVSSILSIIGLILAYLLAKSLI